jgi:hypothetical protein
MEPEGSLPCIQKPNIGHRPEPVEFTLRHLTVLCKDSIYIFFQVYLGFRSDQVFWSPPFYISMYQYNVCSFF